jgi:predicted RNA binding protein YcfA (HicA-like mRNA interferase family)
MKYRNLARLLKMAGFELRQGRGDHEVWAHRNGVSVTITHKIECSAAVTKAALRALKEAKETK